MARLAKKESEKRKFKTYKRYNTKRLGLKESISKLQKDPETNFEALQQVYKELRKLPKNASPVRLTKRCKITGRARGVYSKVGLSKGMFRLYAMNGHIPGLVKASW